MKKYLRLSLIVGILIIMAFSAFVGITVADENTRRLGYSDMPAAVSLTLDSQSISLSIMGTTLTLSNRVLDALEFAAAVYKQTAPNGLKAASALIEIIKMTAGHFPE